MSKMNKRKILSVAIPVVIIFAFVGLFSHQIRQLLVEENAPGINPDTEQLFAAVQDIDIPDTAYDIPTGALFVATNGSDSNSGTEAHPFATLAKAHRTATNGGTIVMRSGTYREAPIALNKKVTIQPYPHEKVWLNGSSVVTGWVRDGSRWRKDDWTTKFCQSSPCDNPATINSSYPTAKYPDMVFVNGLPLRQLDGSGAGPDCAGVNITAGTFCVDYGTSKLFIGDDPTGKTIEAAAQTHALKFGYTSSTTADNSVIRGLGFRQYATDSKFTSTPSIVTVSPDRSNLTFEKNVFMLSAGSGLTVQGTGHDVSGNTFAYNAMLGFHANRLTGVAVEGNTIIANNQEHFVTEGAAASVAGLKMTNSVDVLVKNNIFGDNLANGYWCDLGCKDVRVVRNIARRNEGQGIYYEVSRDGILASNIVYENTGNGIEVKAENIQVLNNTLYANHENLAIFEDDRVTGQGSLASYPNASGETRNVVVKNNIFADQNGNTENGDFGKPPSLVNVNGNHPNEPNKPSPSAMVTAMDHNLYYRPASTRPAVVLQWIGSGVSSQYSSFSSTLRSETGREAEGKGIDGQAIGALFTDASAGNFKLAADSPAINGGGTLSADMANLLGISRNDYVDMGALVAPGLAFSPTDPTPPTPEPDAPICSNDIDDDSDSKTDFGVDPGCESSADTTESPDPVVSGGGKTPPTGSGSTKPGPIVSGGGKKLESGASVSGQLSIALESSACEDSTLVEQLVDGEVVSNDCETTIDTTKLSEGEHEISTRVTYADGTVDEHITKVNVDNKQGLADFVSRPAGKAVVGTAAVGTAATGSSLALYAVGRAEWVGVVLRKVLALLGKA